LDGHECSRHVRTARLLTILLRISRIVTVRTAACGQAGTLDKAAAITGCRTGAG
jgi:hypothetical protein